MTQGINPDSVAPSIGIFSAAAWQPEGKVLHLSGQCAVDPQGNIIGKGDIGAQTRQCLENVKAILTSVGGVMDDVVKVTVYITSMDGFDDIHAVRAEYFFKPYPASTMVEVKSLVLPELLIEIEAVAVIPFDRVIEA